MPVVTEQHSLVEKINDINNTLITTTLGTTTLENSKIPISNNKFATNFPQPNIPIEPLYPAEIKSKTSSKSQLNGGGGGLNGQQSGNSSPLEIVGQTTGQLTKTQSSSVSYSSINSFQVINQDNLIYKPNAIVKPVRRNDIGGLNDSQYHTFVNGKSQRPKTNSAVNVLANVQANGAGDDKSKQMTKNDQNNLNGGGGVVSQANGNNSNISMKNKKNLKFDKVNGSIDYQSVDGGGVSNTSVTIAPHKKTGFFSEMANFAKELNQKLNRLKIDKSPTRSSSKNSTYPQIVGNNDVHNKRPLFITTVPSGVFLPPAKEISPTAQKRVYAFSSRPRIFTIYRTNNNNYPTAAGYYTSEHKLIDNGNETETENKSEYDNDNKNGNQTLNPNNNNTNEKAKSSLNERMKRDVFRGNDDIRPYNYYRNMVGHLSSSSNGSTKQLNDKKDSKREPAPPQPLKNVMHDKRVVRGSNFSQIHCQDQQVYTKEQEAKRRLMLRKRCLARNQRNIIGSPPPIHGRVHIPIQTEKYLEELFDRPPEFDANTQTDLFLQRPPSPPYIPAKIGVDRYTQIEEGELFDFDSEAQPILDTLIGHSVQQSLIETLHEQEMAELKAKQEEFLARREAELAELRRLEEEERRLQEEKERRIKQDEIARENDEKLQEEVTAAKLLQGHIATILPDVLSKLEPQSDFAHKFEVEKKICPWLSKEVAEEVGKIIDSREILTEIIKEIIIQRATVYADFVESETEDESKCYEEECSPEENDGDEEFIREEVDRMIGGVDNIGGDDLEKRKFAGQENDKLETILEENCLPHQTKDRVPIIEDTIVKSLYTGTTRTSSELKSKQDKDELDNQESEQDRDAATYDIDSETIARSEFERILSLADSVDESEDVVTQIENVKQQKIATESTVSATATDDEDDDHDDDDDDDNNEDDEKYLREQIDKMISDAEQSSTNDDSDNNNGISYIS